MKTFVALLGCVACVSCSELHKPYIDGNVRIMPPVKQEKDQQGNTIEESFNDGGTKMIRITDSENRSFDLYIDGRIGRESDWGTIYINGYPDSSNSVRLTNQNVFKKTILKGLQY
jgi:hypothetical protein